MARCSNCRCDLPGLETLCRRCMDGEYERVGHAKRWWDRLRSRFARRNFIGFCIFFVFGFAVFRFDFPFFHRDYRLTTERSAEIAALSACVAFFLDDKSKSQRKTAPPGKIETPPILGRFLTLLGIELLAGLCLYLLFTIMPMFVAGSFALVSWVIAEIELRDPIRTRSLGARLATATGGPTVL